MRQMTFSSGELKFFLAEFDSQSSVDVVRGDEEPN